MEKIFLARWWPLLLALAAFLAYTPSLHSDFVTDARAEIMEEGFVTSLSNLPKILSLQVLHLRLMLSDRPGEMLYLMLNAAVWGKAPFGYHLDSALLHAANAALLLILLRRLVATEAGPGGAAWTKIQPALILSTLIFALHPLATESVSEVSFSSSLLVTFFTLLGLLAGTAFRPGDWKRALLAGTLGTFCALAATATKESGIAVSLLLIVYWFLFRREETRKPWLLFLASTLTVTAAVAGLILHLAVGEQMTMDYLGGSFGQVFLVQPRLWVFMMGQLLWPTRLVADYTLADMNLPSTATALVILVAVLAFQAWLSFRSRTGALGVATWWIGLATVSNFVPLYCFLADRFYYLPLAGAAMQLVAVFLLLAPARRAYPAALGLALATIPFLIGLTIVRQAAFANEESLWTDTLKKSPHSFLAHYRQGVLLIHAGRLSDAADELEQAVINDPKSSSSYLCQGLIDQCRGRIDDAILQFQSALALHPHNSDAHDDLGIALCQAGRIDEGIDQFHAALAIDSDDASAHTNLGMALLQKGEPHEGTDQLQIALQIDPKSVQAHYELGNVLARLGRPMEATEQFRAVLALRPDHVEAATNLGVVEMHQGNFDQAIVQFQQALRLRPDSPDILNDLGVALAQKGDRAGAIAQFQAALRLRPGFDSARANLTRAQATTADRH